MALEGGLRSPLSPARRPFNQAALVAAELVLFGGSK